MSFIEEEKKKGKLDKKDLEEYEKHYKAVHDSFGPASNLKFWGATPKFRDAAQAFLNYANDHPQPAQEDNIILEEEEEVKAEPSSLKKVNLVYKQGHDTSSKSTSHEKDNKVANENLKDLNWINDESVKMNENHAWIQEFYACIYRQIEKHIPENHANAEELQEFNRNRRVIDELHKNGNECGERLKLGNGAEDDERRLSEIAEDLANRRSRLEKGEDNKLYREIVKCGRIYEKIKKAYKPLGFLEELTPPFNSWSFHFQNAAFQALVPRPLRPGIVWDEETKSLMMEQAIRGAYNRCSDFEKAAQPELERLEKHSDMLKQVQELQADYTYLQDHRDELAGYNGQDVERNAGYLNHTYNDAIQCARSVIFSGDFKLGKDTDVEFYRQELNKKQDELPRDHRQVDQSEWDQRQDEIQRFEIRMSRAQENRANDKSDFEDWIKLLRGARSYVENKIRDNGSIEGDDS